MSIVPRLSAKEERGTRGHGLLQEAVEEMQAFYVFDFLSSSSNGLQDGEPG